VIDFYKRGASGLGIDVSPESAAVNMAIVYESFESHTDERALLEKWPNLFAECRKQYWNKFRMEMSDYKVCRLFRDAIASIETEWAIEFFKKGISQEGINTTPNTGGEICASMHELEEAYRYEDVLEEEWSKLIDECMLQYLNTFGVHLTRVSARWRFRDAVNSIRERWTVWIYKMGMEKNNVIVNPKTDSERLDSKIKLQDALYRDNVLERDWSKLIDRCIRGYLKICQVLLSRPAARRLFRKVIRSIIVDA